MASKFGTPLNLAQKKSFSSLFPVKRVAKKSNLALKKYIPKGVLTFCRKIFPPLRLHTL